MKLYFFIAITVTFFTTSLRAEFEGNSVATERLSDRGLVTAHELLYSGLEVGGCEIRSSVPWNGYRYSLSISFLNEKDEDLWLDFIRSNHITSRVKIKKYWFSSAVRELSFEKIDLQSVPITRKDVVRVNFERNGRATEIVHEVYRGSQWNMTKRTQCR